MSSTPFGKVTEKDRLRFCSEDLARTQMWLNGLLNETQNLYSVLAQRRLQVQPGKHFIALQGQRVMDKMRTAHGHDAQAVVSILKSPEAIYLTKEDLQNIHVNWLQRTWQRPFDVELQKLGADHAFEKLLHRKGLTTKTLYT